jgi:hypothetical protein
MDESKLKVRKSRGTYEAGTPVAPPKLVKAVPLIVPTRSVKVGLVAMVLFKFCKVTALSR